MHPYVYFETQTGWIYDQPPKAPSNFYRYTFFSERRAELEAIVERAGVGPSGLELTPADLRWLEANEIDRPAGLAFRPSIVNWED